LSNVNVTGFYP